MLIIQIILIAFALFALFRVIVQFRQGKLPIAWLLFWVVFWAFVVTVTVLPKTTERLAGLVGVGRGADAVIYFSLAFLFYLIFRLFVKIEETERQITKLVRKLALKDFAEPDKKL
jgi:hypothetical protein